MEERIDTPGDGERDERSEGGASEVSGWLERVRGWFSLDARSLALFRVGLATIMLLDLFWRAFDIEAFYTDFGVLPRHTYTQLFANKYVMSFHLMGGTVFSQAILMGVQAVFAAAMLVGFRTRIATVLAWVFLISLHGRNPYILQGGDILFRMLFFWAMFLPTGAVWSVDAALARRRGPSADPIPARIVSAGTIALMLQVFFVYWFTMALKTGEEWWKDYTAVHYALHLDHFATPVAEWLRQYQGLGKVLTVMTAWIEILGPMMALFGRGRVRLAAVVMMIGLHLIFGSALKIGLFPWISAVGWLAIIPGWFWDRIGRTMESARESAWFGARLARHAWTEKLRSRPIRWRAHPAVQAACAFLLIYVFAWNLSGLNKPTTITVGGASVSIEPLEIPKPYKSLAYTLRLDQKWTMFAPRPMKGDGWFVIPGTFADGSVVDLFANEQDGGELSFAKPASVSSTYAGQRWRKYMINIWMRDFKRHRKHYGRYLCRKWNEDRAAEDKLKLIHIYYMKEQTLPEGPAEPECITLWTHWCTGDAKHLPDPPHVAQCRAITEKAKAAREKREKKSKGVALLLR